MFYGASRSSGMGENIGTSVQAASAEARAREAKTEVELLRSDIERLLMITEAMWGILRDKFGYTDDELVNRVMEIDKRDGRVDGKVAVKPPGTCPRCGRTLERKRPMCLYCGQVIARDPFER